MKTYSFLSTYPSLSVVVDPGGSAIVAGTTQIQNLPPRIIRFKHGVFNTIDEATVVLMVKRLILDRRMGMISTFLPHPECLQDINALLERVHPEEAPISLPKAPEMTDPMPSADGEMIKALTERMAKLEEENAILKKAQEQPAPKGKSTKSKESVDSE